MNLSACSKEDVPSSPQQPKHDTLFEGGEFAEFRGSGVGQKNSRFLGRGFNLLEYHSGEEAEISSTSILDLKKISSNTPWSPWGREIPLDILAPELFEEDVYMDVQIGSATDVTRTYSKDSVSISGAGGFAKVLLAFNYARVRSEEEKVYYIRQYCYKTDQRVMWEVMDNAHYQFFLSPIFVNLLRTMSGEDLIKRYGTHLITSYNLGAFADLIITARQNTFTRDELLSLSASVVERKPKISTTLSKKIENNRSSIRVKYMQGGSDYKVSDIAQQSPLSSGYPKFINLLEWQKGIRKGDGTFQSLRENKDGLIPIPDLISDMPLKVKYMSAILHKANPGVNIVYALSDPTNYSPVKYKGEHVYLSMKTYNSGETFIYYGNNTVNDLSERLLTGKGSSSASWSTKLEKSGQWLFYSRTAQRYLCRDLKLRTESEDTQGLRYWVLNPVVPTSGYGYKAWSRLMIKPRF